MSPSTLLHWRCDDVTYSIRRNGDGSGWLYASGPDGKLRRSHRPIPPTVVAAFHTMSDDQRSRLAEAELESL